MSIINRSDVKNHMRPPFLAKIHLCAPESQPDATGFSGDRTEHSAMRSPSGFCCRFRRGTFIIQLILRARPSLARFLPR